MDKTKRIEHLKALIGDVDTADIYIEIAEGEVFRRAYPLGEFPEELPHEYDWLTIQIAQALYLKAGAEGESAHDENGIRRNYTTDGIPQSLLRQIVPVAGVAAK